MTTALRLDSSVQVKTAAAERERPRPSSRRLRRVGTALAGAGWWILSLALFAGIWELAWALGWVSQLTLPPPHIFLSDILRQATFFESSSVRGSGSPLLAVLTSIGATLGRVTGGLLIGFVASLITGILVTQFTIVNRLALPLVTLLAPISPMAWLPIAIFIFGVGDRPAIFMVFIGVYFMMTLATIADINGVSTTYRNVARTLGATRPQMLFLVILPAILPALFRTVRLNLFAAWMMVLVAEAVGVGEGLGQVVMLARNTFNSSLVFFTMVIIGISGYVLDVLFRLVQQKVLWWDPVGEKGAGK